MNFSDKLKNSWIGDLLKKESVSFDSKKKDVYKTRELFDGKKTVSQEKENPNMFESKKKLIEREHGNPMSESKYSKALPSETDKDITPVVKSKKESFSFLNISKEASVPIKALDYKEIADLKKDKILNSLMNFQGIMEKDDITEDVTELLKIDYPGWMDSDTKRVMEELGPTFILKLQEKSGKKPATVPIDKKPVTAPVVTPDISKPVEKAVAPIQTKTNKKEEMRKKAGGESYSDILEQSEAIKSSETQEEAVKKLKDIGYVSEFDPNGDGVLETIEELVDRVWSLHKDPAMKEFGKDASRKTASERPPKEFWDKMYKEVKEGNPSYSEDQISKTIGDIWFHQLSDYRKNKIKSSLNKRANRVLFCPNHPDAIEFISYLSGKAQDELDPDDIGVIVDKYGNATNRWGDGTVGVNREVKNLINEEEHPYCLENVDDEVIWKEEKKSFVRKVKTIDKYAVVRIGDKFDIVQHDNGFDKAGMVIISGLREEEVDEYIGTVSKKASLASELSGAKFVKHDEDTELTYAWFGGHGVHIYTNEGKEVDMFNIGDFSKDSATLEEVEKSIEETIAEDRDEYNKEWNEKESSLKVSAMAEITVSDSMPIGVADYINKQFGASSTQEGTTTKVTVDKEKVTPVTEYLQSKNVNWKINKIESKKEDMVKKADKRDYSMRDDKSGKPESKKPILEKIVIKHILDTDSDLSYLEQDYKAGNVTDAENEKYKAQDKARLDAYNRGDWYNMGIVAEAQVSYSIGQGSRRLEWFKSSGLWGIESDGGEQYIKDEEQNQLADLKEHLEAFGVDVSNFDEIASKAVVKEASKKANIKVSAKDNKEEKIETDKDITPEMQKPLILEREEEHVEVPSGQTHELAKEKKVKEDK